MNSQTRPFETAKVGTLVSDRHRDERRRRIAADAVLRRLQGAEQRERLEVDSGVDDPRLLARVHVAVDQLAIGDDEQDPLSRAPLLVDSLTEHLVVEHSLVDRNRQRLLGPESGPRFRAVWGR